MKFFQKLFLASLIILIPSMCFAVRPAEPSLDLINGMSAADTYVSQNQVTVQGNTQFNTKVILYINGTEFTRINSNSGSWNITLTLVQKPTFYVLTAVAYYPTEPTPDYSFVSVPKNVFVDYTKPAIFARNNSVWQGDSYYVRYELRSLYADVTDVGGSGFSVSPTFDGKITDLTQAGNPTINGTITYANSRISFIPKNGYTTGSFTNNHIYRMWFMIMDRAGNFQTSQRDFIVDYTPPALPDLTTYAATPNLYQKVFIYDPAHVPDGSVGEPSSNYPLNSAQSMAIAGDNRFVGFVRFFNNTKIQTNPTRIIFKFNPGDWGDDPSLKLNRYGDYIDNWNNWGGWYYLNGYSGTKPFPPTANIVDNVNVGKPDASGWMATHAYIRPSGVYVDNWFYWRDAAYNRYTTPHFRYLCTAGPPKAPTVYSSSMYKNGDSKILPDAVGGDRTIQSISGEVNESGDTQNVEAYINVIDAAHLIGVIVKPPTNYVGSDKTFTINNAKGLKYDPNGVSTLYVRATNKQFGAGPYTWWYAAFCDNTAPVVSNAYVPSTIVTAFSSANIPSQIQVDVVDQPFVAWNSIFGLITDTAISTVNLVGYDKFNNRTNYSVNNDSLIWYTSDNFYSGKLTLSQATLDHLKLDERTYYADVSVRDNYGLTGTQSKMKLFAVDNTAPNYVRILPSEGDTVNALEKFTAVYQDPELSMDGSASSGLSFGSGSKFIGDNAYSQLYVYKIIASLKPTDTTRFDILMPNSSVDPYDSVAGQSVLKDHAGNVLPAGTTVELWDINSAVLDKNACLISNVSGNVVVTSSVAVNTSTEYTILYPIPYYYSSDRVAQLVSIPFEPVNMIGNYKVKVVGVDKVGNLSAFDINYNIRFDPPQGLFWLSETGGLDKVTANGLDQLSFQAGPIFTKSGHKVKAGTVVTIYSDLGEFVDAAGNLLADQEPLLPGLQIKTKDDTGTVTFNLRSVQVGRTSVFAKTEAGSALTSILYFDFLPDLVSKLAIVFPGQSFVTTNGTVVGVPLIPTAGVTFDVQVYPLDLFNHPVVTIADRIRLFSSDSFARINGTAQMYVQAVNVAGTYTFQVNEKVAGLRTYTALDIDKLASNITKTGAITIKNNTAKKLLALQQGQLTDAHNVTGKVAGSWNYDAGFSIPIYVTLADEYFNPVSDATANVILYGSSDTQVTPALLSVSSSTNMFTVIEAVPSSSKRVQIVDAEGVLSSDYSSRYIVNSGPATKLQLMVPDQFAVSNIGNTGNVRDRTAGLTYIVTVNAVDDFFNMDARINDVVLLTSSTPRTQTLISPTGRQMFSGVATFAVTEFIATTDRTVGTEMQYGYPFLTSAKSSSYNVVSNLATKFLVLLPGEVHDPSSLTGVAEFPDAQVKNIPFVVKVIAVDDYFNKVSSNSTIAIMASSGDTTFNVVNKTMTAGEVTFQITEQIPVVNQRLLFNAAGYPQAQSSLYLVVNSFEAVKYEVELPGQVLSGGVKTGEPIVQIAGEYFVVTVNALNSLNNFATANQLIHLIGPSTYNPTERSVSESAVVTFSVLHEVAGTSYIKARSDGLQGTQGYAITPNVMVGVKLILPGQLLAPGTLIGSTGTPDVQISGRVFPAAVYSVDRYFNGTFDSIPVTLSANDDYAVISSPVFLESGVTVCPVIMKVAAAGTITASISTSTADAQSLTIIPGSLSNIQLLYPGNTPLPGSLPGSAGSDQVIFAGQKFVITVNAVDGAYNLISSYQGYVKLTLDTTIVSVDRYEKNFVNGVATFSIQQFVATASLMTIESSIYTVTHNYIIVPGDPFSMQIIRPGERASSGVTSNSILDYPLDITAGSDFDVTVNLVDIYNNVITTASPYFINIKSSVSYGSVDFATKNLELGAVTFRLNEIVAGIVTYNLIAENSFISAITVNITAAEPSSILLLVPGEVQAPGYLDAMEGLKGKLGTPNIEKAGTPFVTTVNLVDKYFNTVKGVSSNHLISIISRDDFAPYIPNRLMRGGVATFSIVMATVTTGNNTRTLVGIDNSTISLETPFRDIGLPGFVVVPGNPALIKATSNMNVTANGLTPALLKVTIQDGWKNVVNGQAVIVTVTRNKDVLVTINAISDVSGNAFFTVTSTMAGDCLLSIQSKDPTSSLVITGSAKITFVGDSSNPSPTSSRVSRSKVSAIAGSTDYVMITVMSMDINDNPISGHQISLSSSRGTKDAIVIVNNYTNQAGEAYFKVSSQVLGMTTLNARNESYNMDLSAWQLVSFVPDYAHPSTTNSIIELTPQQLQVARSSTIKVFLVDIYGNVITGNPVTVFTDRPPTVDVVSTINNITGAISGTDFASFRVSSLKAGDSMVYARDINSGYVLSTNLSHKLTFEPAEFDVSASYIEVLPAVVAADGEATGSVVVSVLDAYKNPIRNVSVQLYSTRTPDDVITTINGVTDILGRAFFTVISSTIGNSVFSAGINDSAVLSHSASIYFAGGKISSAKSIVQFDSLSATVNGTDGVTVNIWLRDKMNNPLSGITLNILTSRGAADIITPNNLLSDPSGHIVFKVYSYSAGLVSLNIVQTLFNVSLTENVQLLFTVDPMLISPVTSFIDITPNSIIANNSDIATISVFVRDIYGNSIAGSTINIFCVGVTVNLVTASVKTGMDGWAYFYMKSNYSGSITISAVDELTGIKFNSPLHYSISPDFLHISPTFSSVVLVPAIQAQLYNENYANGKDYAMVKAVIVDIYGNNVNTKTLAAYSDRGTADIIKSLNSSNISGYDGIHAGQSVFYIASTRLGQASVKCYDVQTGTTFNMSATINFVADRFDPSPDMSSFSISPSIVIANGEDSGNVTFNLRDRFGNAISGNAILLTSDRGAKDTITPLHATTDAQGVVTFSVTSTEYGNVFLTLKDNTAKVTMVDKYPIAFKAEPIPASFNSEVKVNNPSIYISSIAVKNELTIYVSARDRFNNPLIGDVVRVTSNRVDDIFVPTASITDAYGRTKFLIRSRYAGQSFISAMHPLSGKKIGMTSVIFTNPATTSSIYLIDKDGNSKEKYALGKDSIYVMVVDLDQNRDSFARDIVTVNLTNLTVSDSELVVLQETDLNSGIFDNVASGVSTNFTNAMPLPSNNIFEGPYKNKFIVSYQDPTTPSDKSSQYGTADIERMAAQWQNVAYMSQAKDHVVFRYPLDKFIDIDLWIYNTRGEILRRSSYPAGTEGALISDQNIVTWDLRDSSGKVVPNGVYVYRLLENNSGVNKLIYTGKLLVVK